MPGFLAISDHVASYGYRCKTELQRLQTICRAVSADLIVLAGYWHIGYTNTFYKTTNNGRKLVEKVHGWEILGTIRWERKRNWPTSVFITRIFYRRLVSYQGHVGWWANQASKLPVRKRLSVHPSLMMFSWNVANCLFSVPYKIFMRSYS